MTNGVVASRESSFGWQYLVVVASFLSAVIRPKETLPITPFYVVLPFVYVWLFRRSMTFRNWNVLGVLIALYALVAGRLYGTPLSGELFQITKYIQLLTLIGLLCWLNDNDPDFLARGIRTVNHFTVAVLLLAVVQQFTGFEFPTLLNEESSLWLNTVFFTPNDVALYLDAAVLLAMVSSHSLGWKIALNLAVMALNLRNDAKAAIIAQVLMILAYGALRLSHVLQIRPIAILTTVIVLLGIVLVAGSEYEIDFNGDLTSASELLLDPLNRMWNLEPYDLGGSVFDRTDALIYAMTAYSHNHYMGLGPGGSVYVLTLPQYELMSAKSLHNAVAELAVDLGPMFILPALWVSVRIFGTLFLRTLDWQQVGRLMFMVALPFLAVSQSAGFISNYAFWTATYLVWHTRRHPAAPLPRMSVAADSRDPDASLAIVIQS